MKQKLFIIANGPEALKIRRNLGLNQADFWMRVGVTQSGGSRYESGRKVPFQVLVLLTIVFGTPSQSMIMYEAVRNGFN